MKDNKAMLSYTYSYMLSVQSKKKIPIGIPKYNVVNQLCFMTPVNRFKPLMNCSMTNREMLHLITDTQFAATYSSLMQEYFNLPNPRYEN